MIQLAFYLGRKSENPGTHWMDRAICWWTGHWDTSGSKPRRVPSRFSHVEFITGRISDGGHAVCWAASNRDGKVRSATINVGSAHWVIVTVPRGDYWRLLEHFQANEGRRYGWLCAAAHVVPRPMRGLLRAIGRHLPYCSNIIAAGMSLGDVWLSPQQLYAALVGGAR